MYNPKEYWEARLGGQFDLGSVGDITFSKSYNQWLYFVRKIVSRRAYARIEKSLEPDFSVLDIGSGTGFYLDLWRLITTNYIGSDLRKVATRALTPKHEKIIQFNIADDIPSSISNSTFDVVSAFDVFFHIVDDAHYHKALANVSRLVRDNGYFVFSDNLLTNRDAYSIGHQKMRTYRDVDRCLANSGFKHLLEVPVFFLMNEPINSSNRYLRKIYRVIARAASANEFCGNLVGCIVVPMDLVLTRLFAAGPSTSIYIYQKSP